MLLADRVMNWPVTVPGADPATCHEITARLRHQLGHARIIKAQSVYERVRGATVDFCEISPVPPAARTIWVEYEPASGGQHGVIGYFSGDEHGGEWELQTLISGSGRPEAMWLGEVLMLPTITGFVVSRDGPEPKLVRGEWLSNLIEADPGLFGGTLHFGVAMFTMALLASHNIETRWVDPPPSRKRSRRPRHNRPLLRYEELEVKPAQAEQPRSVPQGSEIELACHTVRGHFAHYGACCGEAHQPKGLLFGRHERRLWIDEHEAGSPEVGFVETTLQVETD